MTTVKYKVHLSPDIATAVEAAKVNTGLNRLWFFDEDNNLIGLFRWDKILGFTVDGSAKDQLLTDKIPLEMGKVPKDELGIAGRIHLTTLQQQLERLAESELPL
jgi:hypothetical protein